MSKVSKNDAIQRLKEILIKDRQATREAEQAEQPVAAMRMVPAQ